MTWDNGRVLFACGFLAQLASPAPAQSVSNYAIEVTAGIQTNPPTITLSWVGGAQAQDYYVLRKLREDANWGPSILLPGDATNFVDTNVTVGAAYEYGIFKDMGTYFVEGYIFAGILAPLSESRGKVILIVDSSLAPTLALELARLRQDLVGDGWTVLRHDVPRMAADPGSTSTSVWGARSNELAAVKAFITSDYNADPASVKAVFIFGHVPVPYSGNAAPDDHSDHTGAWPGDVFYGTMTNGWTDSSVTSTNSSDLRNWNLPGDGKLDQTQIPFPATLQAGRVDLANLPAFPQGETELLRQYLNKDHNFRHAFLGVQRRGLIDDNFGVAGGEAFAANGWRNFAPFFGPSNIVIGDWLSVPPGQTYLWGYGCGPGTYTSASGVASTSDFVSNDTPIVFTMLFGSYFGDWDSQNNLMRAQLATPTYALTCAWAGRPNWYCHHMGLGETIGFSTRLCQNAFYNTVSSIGLYGTHVALMGDPTLRMHPVVPPSVLLAGTNSSGGVNLSWNPSPDRVVGYYVYSAPTSAGPFARLTTNLLGGTSYTDAVITTNVYMVRAVKLEQTPSGSYYNPSQGIFQSLDGTAGTPSMNLFQPTNNAIFGLRPTIQLSADTFDPANCITNVAFYANGVRIGAGSAPPYSLSWTNVPGGNYSLIALATGSSGSTARSVAVTVHVDNGGAPNLVINPMGKGSFAILGDEALGRVYRIQFVPALSVTNWQSLGTATGNPSGFFQFIDSNGVPQRFYRSVYP